MHNEETAAAFRHQGFASLGRVADDDELDWLRNTFNRVIAEATGLPPAAFDAGTLLLAPSGLYVVANPERHLAGLGETAVAVRLRGIASQLLDCRTDEIQLAWRLFMKPPQAAPTPWHQDAAYYEPPHRGMSIWIALDDLRGETSACLQFVPGSHAGGLRQHRWRDDHFEAQEVDTSAALAVPIGAGAATAHHCLTLHGARSNRSVVTRRAVAAVCHVASAPSGAAGSLEDWK